MKIREMRLQLGLTQSQFAMRYHIPYRTIQNWENGTRTPPDYILDLLEKQIKLDLINKRSTMLPKYDSQKIDLPKRSDYIGAISWLKAIQNHLGSNVVFALDEALMCQGGFGGRNEEYIVWVYGDESVTKYNGVVLLGTHINSCNVKEKNGLRYTDFNRTVYDALTNESILDMQGITEALSKYYYQQGENFEGIFVSPEYQERFAILAKEAVDYYND